MPKVRIINTTVEQYMMCHNHEEPVVIITDKKEEDCPDCGKKMNNAGWIESNEQDCGG